MVTHIIPARYECIVNGDKNMAVNPIASPKAFARIGFDALLNVFSKGLFLPILE